MTPYFALETNDGRTFALSEAASDAAVGEWSYVLREEREEQGGNDTGRGVTAHDGDLAPAKKISCRLQQEASPTAPGADDVALITVAYPILRLAAFRDGVSVGNRFTADQEDSAEQLDDAKLKEGRVFRVLPSSTTCTTYILLRPDDVVDIDGTLTLRLALVTNEQQGQEREQVQVGSSLPRPVTEIADSHPPQLQEDSAGGAEDRRINLAARGLLVERSFKGDGVSDSAESLTRTPTRKGPLVAETPASKGKFVDVAEYKESQELMGIGPPKSKATTKAGRRKDAIGSPVLHDSMEAKAIFATALPFPLAAEELAFEAEAKPKTSKGRKRKSDEDVAVSESINADVQAKSTRGKKQKQEAPDAKSKITKPLEAQDQSKTNRGKKRKSDEDVEAAEPFSAPEVVKGKKRKSDIKLEEPTTVKDPSWLDRTMPKYSSKASRVTPATSPDAEKTTQKGKTKSQRVMFSNSAIPDQPSAMKFLSSHGVKQVENTSARGFDMLVVGKGELKKTFKLLTTIALGKPVVTEAWVLQSLSEGKILEPSSFVPKNSELEKQWNFELAKAISKDHRSLFKGTTLLITPTLKKEYGNGGFKDIEELGKLVGAKKVVSKTFEAATEEQKDASVIVIAGGTDDSEVLKWTQQGHTCFSKDLLSVSILRGEFHHGDDELKIEAIANNHGKAKSRGKQGKAA